MNRKLIRPSLIDIKDQMGPRQLRKRTAPPEQTHAETFYYLKQMQSRTPMVIVMEDGEILHGVIEWYDRDCIKVNRVNAPNLLIMKKGVKYMYKEGENGQTQAQEESLDSFETRTLEGASVP